MPLTQKKLADMKWISITVTQSETYRGISTVSNMNFYFFIFYFILPNYNYIILQVTRINKGNRD